MSDTAVDVLPWSHFDPGMREEIKRLAQRWPAQTVADAAQRFAELMSAHGQHPGTDWRALGWRDQTDHQEFLESLRERTLRLPADAQQAVRERRQQAAIAPRGPYSSEEALTIDALIEEARIYSEVFSEAEIEALTLGNPGVFQITEVVYDPNPAGATLSVTWTSRVGGTYVVESSEDVQLWTELTDGFPDGGATGDRTTIVIPGIDGFSELYVRVREE